MAIAAFNGILATAGAATLAGAIAFFALAILFWLAALVAGAFAGAIAAAATEPDPPAADTTDPDRDGNQPLPEDYDPCTTIAVGDILSVTGPGVLD